VVDPRGLPAVLFSGTGWVVRVPLGPIPSPPAPAVHSDGWTALHKAAWHGNRRIVRLLIAAKADVNAQHCGGCASLLRHRRMGNARCLPCRETPLHCAVRKGHFGTVEELLLSGADVAVQELFG
jgi:ankyrin repeat protein